MLISFDSTNLINEATELMNYYGTRFEVYAVYSLRNVDDEEFEYISDFVEAKEPTKDDTDSDEEYQRLVSEWKAGIHSLKGTKNSLMPIGRLINLLKEQNSTI